MEASNQSLADGERTREQNVQQDFCQYLINLREKAEYSQSRAAHATRISLPFVEALEEGNIAALPGVVFARGFLKNLSKIYTGDVDASLLAKFDSLCDQQGIQVNHGPYIEEPAAVLPGPESKGPFKISWRQLSPSYYFRGLPLYLTHAALLSLLVLSIWGARTLFWGNEGPDDVVVTAPKGEVAAEVEAVAMTAETPTANKPDPVVSVKAVVAEESAAPQSHPSGVKAPADLGNPNPEPGVDETQRVTMTLPKDATLRVKLDNKQWASVDLSAADHLWEFDNNAEFYLPDPEGIVLEFNGQKFGPLKSGSGYKRLSFNRQLPNDSKSGDL